MNSAIKPILIVLLLGVLNHIQAQNRRVLFLGNSYTYYNDLPNMISKMASSNGDSLYYESNTPGGHTLQSHTTNTNSIQKIQKGNWDYVVLQEQSQRPSFPPAQVQQDVYPYAEFLDSVIATSDSCAETMFYMTWGRKYGDAQNCQFYAPLCTYSGMQKRLRDSYVEMAINNQAEVAPVGMAFKKSIKNDSTLNLYAGDNSHPSIFGSYLAACVFYSSIFHKSSMALYHPSSISSGTANYLQQIADSTVFDSLQTWRIDTNRNFFANFQYTLSALTVNFTDLTGLIGATYHWNFGDGATSSMQNPSHTYAQPGQYQVMLVVEKNCESQSIQKYIQLTSTGAKEVDPKPFKIYPNPSNGNFKVRFFQKRVDQIKIFNLKGQEIFGHSISTKADFEIRLDQEGMYLLYLYERGVLIGKEKLVVY